MALHDRIGSIALALLLTCAAAAAQSPRTKPQPSIGVDPGGTAIGLLTTGIDYTRPEFARCLARDGEGRLIAWDIVDRDPLPFGPASAKAFDENTLLLAVNCVGRARIIPVRVDPFVPATISAALAFLSRTPARVIVMPARVTPDDWRPFRAAAIEFLHLHILIAVSAQAPGHPPSDLANITMIAAESADGASLVALARAVELVACNESEKNSSLTGAQSAAVLAEQLTRSPTPPIGIHLQQKCL